MPEPTRYRLLIDSNHGNATWVEIAEVEFRLTVGGADILTGSATVTTSDGAGAVAIDDNAATQWDGQWSVQPCYIQFDLPSPPASAVLEYTLKAPAANVNRTPKSWRLQSWNGATWDTLHTVPGTPPWKAGQQRAYQVGRVRQESSYQFVVTANQGSAWCSLFEVEMHTSVGGADLVNNTDCFLDASATYGGYTPDKAADGNLATCHTINSGGSVTFYVHFLNPIAEIAEYLIYGNNSTECWKSWTLKKFNVLTGAYDITIDTVTDEAKRTVSEWRTYGCDTIPAPIPPQGLACSFTGDDGTLSWDALVGATAYNLYRGESPGVTKATGTKLAGVTSPYTDSDRPIGTYYYVATAENAGGESDESAEVSGTVAATAAAQPVVMILG